MTHFEWVVVAISVTVLGGGALYGVFRLANDTFRKLRKYPRLQQRITHLEQDLQDCMAELDAVKARTEAILCSVPDPFFVLDDRGRVLLINPPGEALIETAQREKVELFSKDLLSDDSSKGVLEVGGRAYQGLASSLEGSGGHQGLVVVYRDVTYFREVDQMKTQFILDVSHELRTPLANLMLYLDLLATRDDPDHRRSYLETLQRETRRLADLIQDILSISRLEADHLQISLAPVDVGRLLSELADDRGLMALGQGLTLSYERSAHLPFVQADAALLNQCLSNLLTNAISYTPPGGHIRLWATLDSASPPRLAIHVGDDGVGILPEEQQRIFERFYRGSASRQTGAPGTGLGLAISKEIVERMGGEITVESKPGKGSTFTVCLPLAPDIPLGPA